MRVLHALRSCVTVCGRGRRKCNWRHVIQCSCLLFLLGVIVEILAFNVFFIYIYFSTVNAIQNFGATRGNIFDKIQAIGIGQDFVGKVKNGGLSSLLQHTVDRLYIIPVRPENGDQGTSKGRGLSDPKAGLFVLGVDTSDAGEPLFIYKRILMRRSFPFARLVVDIGANDGLLGSNSYNFIHWGWNAILVEPLKSQIALAKQNTKRYRSVFRQYTQNVTFVDAVIGTRNGIENLVLSRDIVSMESHVLKDEESIARYENRIITVQSMTVKTFASHYKVPKYFGVLSIDAEGMGDKILHQWINLDYRPAYIIYEQLHNPEPLNVMKTFLEKAGYTLLTRRGWNYIFEYTQR